jgi:hypothetical protein
MIKEEEVFLEGTNVGIIVATICFFIVIGLFIALTFVNQRNIHVH